MLGSLEDVAAGLILAFWLGMAWFGLLAARRLPALPSAPPARPRPALSVIVPARNEARTLPRSVPSLVGQTYPGLEVIVLDDRSTDGTGAALDALAYENPRLTVIHLTALPAGWLGKTHALYVGSQAAQGDWLLFTDADVIFRPGCLEAAVAYAEAHGVDHLVATPRVPTVGFWETILVSCFGLLFALAQRPWRVSDPRSRAFIGIGAFNLIRRSAYQAIGTHRALAMAVVDDLELGRLVKAHGLRQAVVRGEAWLEVRWQVGLSGVVSGLEKNAFASVGYSLLRALATCLGLAAVGILPFLAPLVGGAGMLWGAAVLLILAIHGRHARQAGLPVWSALFHPLAIAVLVYALLRSTLLAIARGGIQWRGITYPLESLRRHSGK